MNPYQCESSLIVLQKESARYEDHFIIINYSHRIWLSMKVIVWINDNGGFEWKEWLEDDLVKRVLWMKWWKVGCYWNAEKVALSK